MRVDTLYECLFVSVTVEMRRFSVMEAFSQDGSTAVAVPSSLEDHLPTSPAGNSADLLFYQKLKGSSVNPELKCADGTVFASAAE